MSDFSGLEQSFVLPAMPVPAVDDFVPALPTELQPHEVSFRRLRGTREIARVQHLRKQISLPAAALGDAGFASREKKETSWVS